MNSLNILVLEEQDHYRDLIYNHLQQRGCDIYTTDDAGKAVRIARGGDVDIAFIDISLARENYIDILKRLKYHDPSLTIIVVASSTDSDHIIDVFKLGGYEILLKPFDQEQLEKTLERTPPWVDFQRSLKEDEVNFRLVKNRLMDKLHIIGSSSSMKHVFNMLARVAQSDTTVLITGESGTGKELVARGIHSLSPRSQYFFHSVNCSAVPDTLFESEFFGHNKGAFTGAVDNARGWFEIAQNGTLFLDEISEMPMSLQAKFLRVLEEKVVNRIGAKNYITLDLRVIAATNQNIEKLVEKNQFRIDLYHRLSPFIINIPPLRKRKEDIPDLVEHYTEYFSRKLGRKITSIDEKVYSKLENYSFPGNVRELKNIIERAVIINDGSTLWGRNINLYGKPNGVHDKSAPVNEFNLAKIEKNVIMQALNHCRYNKSKAAALLEISRQALDRKIQKYDIIFGQLNS